MILRIASAAACAGLLGVMSFAGAPPAGARDDVTRVCTFTDERFTEISGMTYSLRRSHVLWLHNDSGDGPRIYAVDASTCQTLATVTIAGIEARDIEAIASGRDRRGRPVLWIGDLGDNLDSWPEVRIYRIREPRTLVDQVVEPKVFRVTYRDRPHNAEALLADPDSGRLWIVTKQLAHGRLYALPERLSETSLNIARPIRREGGLVTDGAVSPDGARYVLRDYVNAQVFDGLPPGDPAEAISLPLQPQGEAVTWSSDGQSLLIASERDGRLLRVDLPKTVTAPSPTPPDSSSSVGSSASPGPETKVTAPQAESADGSVPSDWLPLVVAGGIVAVAAVGGAIAVQRRRRPGG